MRQSCGSGFFVVDTSCRAFGSQQESMQSPPGLWPNVMPAGTARRCCGLLWTMKAARRLSIGVM